MESYELKDTDDNILDTLLHDSISRNLYLYRFLDLLNTIDGSVSLAVNGRWGTGKTFFVKQAKLLLEAENEFFVNRPYYDKVKDNSSWKKHKEQCGQEFNPVLPVYYDAWLNDNATDPILSIVYEIIEQLDLKEEIKGKPEFKEIIKGVAIPFVENKTGVNIEKFLDSLDRKDYLEEISTQQLVHERVEEFISNVKKERGNRLVIFIDELDRCRPDYAVNLLERIKHYFSNENVTYVFSVNIYELQHTIKRFYGDGFSSTEYLDRFFDLTIDIPLINVDKYFNSICFGTDDLAAKVCKVVVSKLDFSMRQAERFSKIVRIAIYNNKFYKNNPTWAEEKAKFFMVANVAPLIIGLRMANAGKYRDFIDGKDGSFLCEVYEGENEDLADFFMVDRNESFIEGSDNYVDYKERLTEIYQAIFSDMYTKDYKKDIGQMTFGKDSKAWLLNVTNLFSLQIEF